MRWLAATLLLLVASVGLVAGIYLRDRATPWLPPPQSVAHTDADAVLAALSGGDCHLGCAVQLLVAPRPRHWVARIEVRSTTECFDIDVEAFSFNRARGLSGVKRVGCPHTSSTTTVGATG
jgi:hypothetical protein